MPSNDAYTVSIIVDGVPLDEFEVEQNGNVYCCWIASEAGKNFSVRWSGAAQDTALKCSIHTDGQYMQGKVYLPGSQPINTISQGRYISANSVRLYAFSKVLLTDDDSIVSPDQNVSNLGMIEARIHRVETERNESPVFKDTSEFDSTTIHERSKKLAMHHVSLEKTKDLKDERFYTSRNLENDPHARFIFRYRPREYLISQGIIPGLEIEPARDCGEGSSSNSSSPNPKGKKRRRADDADSEDEAENARRQEILSEKEKQLRDLQAEIDQLRRDGGCVKREVKVEPLAFPIDENGVIDLTD